MRDTKGITLISLIITIIVMLIIAGVATYSGIEAINTTKKTAFISEMEMIQAKVNTIYEKRKESTQQLQYYNEIGQDISKVEESKLTTVLGETPKEGFRYFSKKDLKTLELENINQEVIINYDTREVISLTGIKIKDMVYYKLKEIPNYEGYNVEYNNTNTQSPTFTVETTKIGEMEYRITLKNIVLGKNINGGVVSYKLHDSTNWILNGENTSFTVKTPGIYDIKFTDRIRKQYNYTKKYRYYKYK